MLLSRKLFNQFFPNFESVSNQELEIMLNAIGIEVESIFEFEKTENLIVGLIKKVSKHPKSNKLNVCEVEINNQISTIICGANNVRENLKVIVAQPGTKMIDGRLIESKELLGIKSNGMICAYNELTSRTDFIPEEEKEEIIELDNIAELNDINPLKYIGLDDTILDLSVPSNRNELNGVIGIGLDLISVYFPDVELSFDFDFESIQKNNINLSIDKNLCNFLGTIKLSNFKNKRSSWKVKSFLMNSGHKPKNVLVDLTNLNAVLTSNPSHCYDANFIGNSLVVKSNETNIQIKGLDKKEYKIDSHDAIVVYSKEKPVSLAGIIGCDESVVNANTENVVFEVANFNNLIIRKLSDKLNLKTNSSTLFSKRIPLWITLKSFDVLINLLEKSNSTFDGISFTKYHLEPKIIDLNFEEIKKLLGINFENSKIELTLNQMGYKIVDNKIIVPIYREDIETISDIVEELVKKIDINNLEEKPITDTEVNFDVNVVEDNKKRIETLLVNKGFSLVKTLNLTSKSNNEEFNLFNTHEWVKIINPISNEREYFRNNLIQQHLEVIASNSAKKNTLNNIFEIQGLIYDNQWLQHLCITLCENLYINKVTNQFIKNDLLTCKALIIDVLNQFNLKPHFEINDLNSNVILKNNSLKVYIGDILIGYAGQINPQIAKKYGYIDDNEIYFVELLMENILKQNNNKSFFVKDEKTSHEIVKFITATIDETKNYNDILSIFKKYENNKIIDKLKIESVFKKENSIAYTFSFVIVESALKTKTQDEINNVLNAILDDLAKNNMFNK